jgi:hypothetical protein
MNLSSSKMCESSPEPCFAGTELGAVFPVTAVVAVETAEEADVAGSVSPEDVSLVFEVSAEVVCVVVVVVVVDSFEAVVGVVSMDDSE